MVDKQLTATTLQIMEVLESAIDTLTRLLDKSTRDLDTFAQIVLANEKGDSEYVKKLQDAMNLGIYMPITEAQRMEAELLVGQLIERKQDENL